MVVYRVSSPKAEVDIYCENMEEVKDTISEFLPNLDNNDTISITQVEMSQEEWERVGE